MHNKPWFYHFLLAAGLALAGFSGATSAAGKPADTVSPGDAVLASTNCAIGEEKFLPGDYYYCLATQTYGRHRFSDAQRFFKEAAAWGSKPAQYVLGVMALNGDHQATDRPLALAWFRLAAERHRDDFSKAYQALNQSATEQEQQAAAALYEQLRATYADATAAVRAERRYHDGMQALDRLGAGANYCVSGTLTDAQLSGGNPTGDGAPAVDPTRCPSVAAVAATVDRQAASLFDGWRGHVTVGDLQQLPVAPH